MKVRFQMFRVIVINIVFLVSSSALAGPLVSYCTDNQISKQTRILLEKRNLLSNQYAEIVSYYNERISEFNRFAEIARINRQIDSYHKYKNQSDEFYFQMLSKTQPLEREGLEIENSILFGPDEKCFSRRVNYSGKGTLQDFVNARAQCFQNQTGIAYQTGSSPNVGSCSQFFSCLRGKGFVKSQSGRFSTPQGYEIMCNLN